MRQQRGRASLYDVCGRVRVGRSEAEHVLTVSLTNAYDSMNTKMCLIAIGSLACLGQVSATHVAAVRASLLRI